MRTCSRCLVPKEASEFYPLAKGLESRSPDGLRATCKECSNQQSAEARRQNPATPERRHAWYIRSGFDKHLQRRYGITRERFDVMLIEQCGRCAVCLLPLDGIFDVDHHHETGQVRGLLHRGCNKMLGFARENPDILRGGAEYLERFKA